MPKVTDDEAAVEQFEGGPAVSGEDLLDEIAREGARRMLAAALEAEVGAYIDAHAGQVDDSGYRLVVRNGYHEARQVLTSAGAIDVRAPRSNDKRLDESGDRKRFSSAILPAWARKSPRVAEVLPVSSCMACRPPTSPPPFSSSWAPTPGCRRPWSPG